MTEKTPEQILVDQTIRRINQSNKWLLALFLALLFALVIQVAVTVYVNNNGPALTRVIESKVQTVNNRVSGAEGPAARLDTRFISVDAEKCNDSAQTLTVRTTLTWDNIDPRGTLIQDSVGVQEIEPGCNTASYNVSIPEIVKDRTLQLIDQFPRLECIQWALVGIDDPIDPNLAPEGWRTEAFCLYPADQGRPDD